MKAAEPVVSKDADVTEEELAVIAHRLKTLDADRRSTTPSQDVFRSLLQTPASRI